MIIQVLKILGLFVLVVILIIAIFFGTPTGIRCMKINKQQTVGNEIIGKIKLLKEKNGQYPSSIEQLVEQIPGVTKNYDPAGTFNYKNKFFVYMPTEDRENFDLSFPANGIDFASYYTGTDTWFGTCR